MPSLAFGTSSTLSANDDARLSRLEASLPRSISGGVLYSAASTAIPSSSSVLANGQISPSGIAATGNTFPFVVQGQFAFSWDGANLNIWWDGSNGSVPFVIRRADNSNFSIPKGSMQIGALMGKTLYSFAPFISVAQPTRVSFVAGDSGSPRFAFSPSASADSLLQAAQTQRLTINESLTTGLITYTTGTASTTNAGSGSGNYTGADATYDNGTAFPDPQ